MRPGAYLGLVCLINVRCEGEEGEGELEMRLWLEVLSVCRLIGLWCLCLRWCLRWCGV